MTIPLVEPNVREQMATQARNEAKCARPAHPLGLSAAIVQADLWFHLPPAACKGAAGERLKIAVEGGGWFARTTYDIVAVGDFTRSRLEKLLEAAKPLHGHFS